MMCCTQWENEKGLDLEWLKNPQLLTVTSCERVSFLLLKLKNDCQAAKCSWSLRELREPVLSH